MDSKVIITQQDILDYIGYISSNKNLLNLKVINHLNELIINSKHDDFYAKQLLSYLERERNELLKFKKQDEENHTLLSTRLFEALPTHQDIKEMITNTIQIGHYWFGSGDFINQKYFIDLVIGECLTAMYWLRIAEKEERNNLSRIDKDRHKVIDAIALLKQYSDNQHLNYELDKLASQEISTRITEKIIYKSTFFTLSKGANEFLGLPLTTKAKDLANVLMSILLDHNKTYKPSKVIEYIPYQNVGFYYYK